MTEAQTKMMRMVGYDSNVIESVHDRILRIEKELIRLNSYVNSIGKTELVGKGTADDPFLWTAGMELVPNAYYLHEGVRYVWMGKAVTAENPPADHGGEWAEF